MTVLKKAVSAAAIAMLLGSGALLATASAVSANVVCNAEGDCWHTDARVKYPPAVSVQIHPDDWYFHQHWDGDRDHHYRDYHDGHGYYRGGVWVQL